MEEKKKHEYDDPEQSARFVETMRELEADDAKERFEEALKRILFTKKESQARAKEVIDSLPFSIISSKCFRIFINWSKHLWFVGNSLLLWNKRPNA